MEISSCDISIAQVIVQKRHSVSAKLCHTKPLYVNTYSTRARLVIDRVIHVRFWFYNRLGHSALPKVSSDRPQTPPRDPVAMSFPPPPAKHDNVNPWPAPPTPAPPTPVPIIPKPHVEYLGVEASKWAWYTYVNTLSKLVSWPYNLVEKKTKNTTFTKFASGR